MDFTCDSYPSKDYQLFDHQIASVDVQMLEPDIMIKTECNDNFETTAKSSSLSASEVNNYNEDFYGSLLSRSISSLQGVAQSRESISSEIGYQNYQEIGVLKEKLKSVQEKAAKQTGATKCFNKIEKSLSNKISKIEEQTVFLKSLNINTINQISEQKKMLMEEFNDIKIKIEVIEESKKLLLLELQSKNNQLASLHEQLKEKQIKLQQISEETLKREKMNQLIESSSNEVMNNLSKEISKFESLLSNMEDSFFKSNDIINKDQLSLKKNYTIKEKTPICQIKIPKITLQRTEVPVLSSSNNCIFFKDSNLESEPEKFQFDQNNTLEDILNEQESHSSVSVEQFENSNFYTETKNSKPSQKVLKNSNKKRKRIVINKTHNLVDKKRKRIDINKTHNLIDINDPKYKKPFDYGWKRELVVRREKNPKSTVKPADVYYYTAGGLKFRSCKEIAPYIKGTELTISNFTFYKKLTDLNDITKEWKRDAVPLKFK